MTGIASRLALLLALGAMPLSAAVAAVDEAAVAAKVARYWNLGAADADTMKSRVVIRVSFDADGKPVDFLQIEAEGPSQAGIDKLFDSARRAVNRAYADGGLPLPLDEHDSWRVLDLVFDANGMRLR
jgi:hypothetical protein